MVYVAQESVKNLNLDAYCAGSISQVVHGTLELTAAVTLLADFCTILQEHPFGVLESRVESF